MKAICFYFQVHQPYRLRTYRFFDIGASNDYFDEYANRTIMRKVAEKCYLPTNQVLYDLIQAYGSNFKISFSISGTALSQFEQYAPDVLESFRQLVATGSVEILSETYSHSLSALTSKEEFTAQVMAHRELVQRHFGITPRTFRNTELIYSDHIGGLVADLGFEAMLTEGAKHVLGWRSPDFVYYNPVRPELKLLLKNFRLSDDIAFRFSDRGWSSWPLTTEKYVNWLNDLPQEDQVVNLFMDYETFGEHQWASTGIFEFLRALPHAVFSRSGFKFLTPSEVVQTFKPVAPIHVPHPISWADEERDLTAWLGNDLQDDAFAQLYQLKPKIDQIRAREGEHGPNASMLRDWKYLQTSDHFYYMCTKFFSDGDVHKYFNPYDSPYQAFINFMNALSDFSLRVNQALSVVDLPTKVPSKPALAVAEDQASSDTAAPTKKVATKVAPAKAKKVDRTTAPKVTATAKVTTPAAKVTKSAVQAKAKPASAAQKAAAKPSTKTQSATPAKAKKAPVKKALAKAAVKTAKKVIATLVAKSGAKKSASLAKPKASAAKSKPKAAASKATAKPVKKATKK
jgi:alpha-amylase